MGALQAVCASGLESPSYGDPTGGIIVPVNASGGWTAMKVDIFHVYDYKYSSLPSALVYDAEEGYEDGVWTRTWGWEG